MTDSTPILGDSSAILLWLGIAAIVIAVAAALVLVDRFVGIITVNGPQRRTVIAASVVGVLAAAGAVSLITQSVTVHNATVAKQVASIAEAWDLAPTDAKVLLDARGAFFSSYPVWVKLDGKTQQARLSEQYGNYLLLKGGYDDDDVVVPISPHSAGH